MTVREREVALQGVISRLELEISTLERHCLIVRKDALEEAASTALLYEEKHHCGYACGNYIATEIRKLNGVVKNVSP